MSEGFIPLDHVRHIETGEEFYVSSAHHVCMKSGEPRRMFSICRYVPEGEKRPLFYEDECVLIHRHDYKPYKGISRCDCGEVYTTMADEMMPRGEVNWQ